MNVWQIQVLKYDHRLHITFPAELIEDDGECLQFRAQAGGDLNHITRGWIQLIQRPWDFVAWRGRWYNVYLNVDEQGAFSNFYCNVALPPLLEDHRLSFVDLDLDVQMWADGRVEILDEDEFIEHTALFAYPDEVQRAARQAVDDLLALYYAKTPPFDR